MTARRRRRNGIVPANILRVAEREEIWVQASREKVLERYAAHLEYLEDAHPITPRTLTRQVAAFRRDKLLKVENWSRFDKARGEWVQQRNAYFATRAGILWIKLRTRALRIPSVV